MDALTDVLIIGAGPAGLQAAVHSARRKAATVVIGRNAGSALHKAEVENLFGVAHADGAELLAVGREQAERFGAELFEEEATGLSVEDGLFVASTDHGRTIKARSLVLAVGISRARLGVPGEKELQGKGVSYCASCDAGFYREKTVAVIGEDSEAAESAALLTKYASKVYWVRRSRSASEHMVKMVEATSAEILDDAPTAIVGDSRVSGLDLKSGRRLSVDGVFISLGAKGSLELAIEVGIIPDPEGMVEVDGSCRTSVEGVYACGDVTGRPWQAAKAIGQGCVAGEAAAKAALEKRGA